MAARRSSAPRKAAPRRAPSTATPSNDHEAPRPRRAIWTGSVGFGLVQIPVRVYPRERPNDIAFHQIDRRDRAPIGYERINKETHEAVDWRDVAKGWEVRKGEFVIVDDEDFEKANVEASRTIEIQDFVPATSIEPAYYDRPYVLSPDGRGNKAYFVLRDALAKRELAAVGLVVLRTRQHLCAVFADGDALSLELLRFAHELRPAREVGGVGEPRVKATPKEVALAEQLIDRMVVDWDPAKYRDSYRDELLAALREKAKTGKIEPRNVPARRGPAPLDLAALLEKSVAGARKKKNKRAASAHRAHRAHRVATGLRATGYGQRTGHTCLWRRCSQLSLSVAACVCLSLWPEACSP